MANTRCVLQYVVFCCAIHYVFAKSMNPSFDEPVCSKFHFEENVLEKLVRLEFRVEQTSESVNKAILDLKNKDVQLGIALDMLEESQDKKRHDTKAELDAEILALNETVNEDVLSLKNKNAELKTALDESEEKQEKKRNDLKAELGAEVLALKEELVQLKKERTAKSVAFVARNPPTSLPDYALVPFRTTVLNVGEAYDSSTGRFTAPVSGIYLFTAQFCTTRGITIYFQLMVNDNIYGVSHHFEASTDGVCSSMTTVGTMQAGEKAWVKNVTGNVKVVADNSSWQWNMFTAVLISKN